MRGLFCVLVCTLVVGCGKKNEEKSEPAANVRADAPVQPQRAGAPDSTSDWTHRDLAEHLSKKGVPLKVRSGGLILGAGSRPVALLVDGESAKDAAILVFLCADMKDAREMAATLDDDGFAFKRFAIGAGRGERKDDLALLNRINGALK